MVTTGPGRAADERDHVSGAVDRAGKGYAEDVTDLAEQGGLQGTRGAKRKAYGLLACGSHAAAGMAHRALRPAEVARVQEPFS
jgi:hypothetical protein